MNRSNFPWRLFARIVLIQSVLVLTALGASGLAARYFFKRQFTTQVREQLRVTLDVLGRDLPLAPPADWCAAHASKQGKPELRLTVIKIDGLVFCDSHQDPKSMENHASRPEVAAALKEGFGSTIRESASLGEEMLYDAVPASNRAYVVRGAIPLDELRSTLGLFDTSLSLFLVFLGSVVSVFAIWSAKTLVFPIGRLLVKARNVLSANEESLDGEARGESYGELTDLEDSLENIRRDLEAKSERLDRQKEEQATIMGAISDSILAVDLDGAPLFYNSRFAVLFGRDGFRESRPRLWEIFREPEILDAFKRALKAGKAASARAIPVDHQGGRMYFSLSVSPLRRGTGEAYGAVGIFHDVTELKRAEQIRIDFVANVSHELRTPLTAIKGYADTLAQDARAGRPVETDFIEVINRNTARLMSLISDLLDLSSLESNVEDLAKVLIDTSEATARVLSQMKGNFDRKKQVVEIETEAKSVLADPRRLEQVLVNLLDNAHKYTPAGGMIRVVWQPSKRKGETLLKVIDSGPGIPQQHHERLFERFYRVDKARSRELGGTGLGLAIVKHIMQRHGGEIWVESELGKGAAFIAKFPGAPLD